MSELEVVLNRYYEVFQKNYPLCITDDREERKIIADIKLCIDTGKEATEPEYEDEIDY
ncbi:MAG: hypothetical protein OSJ52_12865 [Lachnospiraceae bacterium]|nr:hypothetical protein [Lachnospiraceae bacterium]